MNHIDHYRAVLEHALATRPDFLPQFCGFFFAQGENTIDLELMGLAVNFAADHCGITRAEFMRAMTVARELSMDMMGLRTQ